MSQMAAAHGPETPTVSSRLLSLPFWHHDGSVRFASNSPECLGAPRDNDYVDILPQPFACWKLLRVNFPSPTPPNPLTEKDVKLETGEFHDVFIFIFLPMSEVAVSQLPRQPTDPVTTESR